MLTGIKRRWARVSFFSERVCCICGSRVGSFLPYRRAGVSRPPLMVALEVVGSDVDNFTCPVCGCHDRERHLKLYFDSMELFGFISGARVLHFAPEENFSRLINECKPMEYVMADLQPSSPEVNKVDMMNIPYGDRYFDFIIANHVLEHVEDINSALQELYRVLRPGGYAVLQTPYSRVLHHTFSDQGITSGDVRLQAYGQEDHVRLFGRDVFMVVESVGFESSVVFHQEVLKNVSSVVYGVNADEPFFLFRR